MLIGILRTDSHHLIKCFGESVDNIIIQTEHEITTMAAIILGKNLLSTEELIEHAFSDMNTTNSNLAQLKQSACDAAIHSSLLLIRMMRAERIYIETQPLRRKTPLGPTL